MDTQDDVSFPLRSENCPTPHTTPHLDIEARLCAGLYEVDVEFPCLGIPLLNRNLPVQMQGGAM